MTCKSIYNITHHIGANASGFYWTNCEPNMFVMHNGEILHPGDGSPIAFWMPDHKIGFANLPKFIPDTVKEAVAIKRYLVMDGAQNPNPSAAWLEQHTWQLLGQGRNGETIIITTTKAMNLYVAAALLIEAGAIWGGDLDSGGSVSTKCGNDIISVENRLVANFIAIDMGGEVPPDGGNMTTVTRWTGNIETVKPLRDGPGGDATAVVLSKGTFVKADEKVDRWIRLIEPGVAAGLWASYTWLVNFQEIQEEITDPTDPPPASSNPAWFKLTNPEGVEDYYDKRV